MTSEMILYLAMGAMAGGFINGLSGSGTALFAMGFYLVVLDPITAVAIVALMSVLAGFQGIWIVRDQIVLQKRGILRFLLPGLIGVPIGISLLGFVDATTVRIMIATLLIVYGAYFGLRAALPSFSRETPLLDSIIGFIGGTLGGAVSVSGAIPSMWLSLRPWPKSKTRAVLQSYNMAILSTTITLLFLKGAYTQTALVALLITVPIGLIAAQVGIAVFRALSDVVFRRLLIILTLLMGLGILVSEIT